MEDALDLSFDRLLMMMMMMMMMMMYIYVYIYMLVPVAARSKVWVCGRSPAEIAGSNSAGDMDVC